MDIMPFDELNKFKAALPQYFEGGKIKADAFDSLLDMLEDLFLLSFANGVQSSNLALSSNIEPSVDDVERVVNKEIAGKTWRDRVQEYFDKARKGEIPLTQGEQTDNAEKGQTNLTDAIIRIAETEAHRDSNAGAYEAAKAAGATEKTWHCMMLPTSRDTHVYLDGVTAPIDGEFYSFNGGSTKYPSEWGIAEEDINCLCWLTYK